MNKLFKIVLSCVVFSQMSCTDEILDSHVIIHDDVISGCSNMHISQAVAYAQLFQPALDKNDQNPSHNKSERIPPVVHDVDVLVENGDTLLFAINYGDNEGYVLISGDNSMFPILGHSSEGAIHFCDMDKSHPMNYFIQRNKDRVIESRKNGQINEYYENWKDLGNDEYEYTVEIQNSEPFDLSEGNKRRTESSGKASIYPYTGKELDAWCQVGGYNYNAKNRACVGCPALSIAMLMYDTSNRFDGYNIRTTPSFDYSDHYDIYYLDRETHLSKNLRIIGDNIPNYNWGKSRDMETGASANDIKSGLVKLGYKKANYVTYNLDAVYENLSFDGIDYFGNKTKFHRGVLIAGFSSYGGHIWFCDGYYEQGYIITKKKKNIFGKVKEIKTWNEYDDMLYMNWGWGNEGNFNKTKSNGWFSANDEIWKSIDSNVRNVNYKNQTIVFVNLNYYENN